MVNKNIINLTLWADNTKLFHNIKIYLCDKNKGELHYIIDGLGEKFYKHSCSYKSRNYMLFLNHMNSISKFQKRIKTQFKKQTQKKFKIYYKEGRPLNMFPEKIYLVSVVLYNSLQQIHIFSNRDDATDFAFNEARDAINSDLSYSEDGNYILLYKKNKITIATHHISSNELGSEIDRNKGICLVNSYKIIYNKPHIIDLNDSGVITAEDSNGDTSSCDDGNCENVSCENGSCENDSCENGNCDDCSCNSDSKLNGNIYMDIDEIYINKDCNELLEIFSTKEINDSDTNDIDDMVMIKIIVTKYKYK